MGRAQCGDHFLDRPARTEHFEPPLGDFLAAAFFADRRIRFVRTEERARARQAKTALPILADAPGAGSEHRIADLGEILVRREDDDLADAVGSSGPQRADVFQA